MKEKIGFEYGDWPNEETVKEEKHELGFLVAR